MDKEVCQKNQAQIRRMRISNKAEEGRVKRSQRNCVLETKRIFLSFFFLSSSSCHIAPANPPTTMLRSSSSLHFSSSPSSPLPSISLFLYLILLGCFLSCFIRFLALPRASTAPANQPATMSGRSSSLPVRPQSSLALSDSSPVIGAAGQQQVIWPELTFFCLFLVSLLFRYRFPSHSFSFILFSFSFFALLSSFSPVIGEGRMQQGVWPDRMFSLPLARLHLLHLLLLILSILFVFSVSAVSVFALSSPSLIIRGGGMQQNLSPALTLCHLLCHFVVILYVLLILFPLCFTHLSCSLFSSVLLPSFAISFSLLFNPSFFPFLFCLPFLFQ